MTKMRNAWPAVEQAGYYACMGSLTHWDRVTGQTGKLDRVKRSERDDARKRYALIDYIQRNQRLGKLTTTRKTAAELVAGMSRDQVADLYRKIIH